ncbi:MAG: hypothetical protein QGG89_16495, partial [Vicinamibacterales bacterium]|nr:hypothetical protein [Vicinamibacterales bacterium]
MKRVLLSLLIVSPALVLAAADRCPAKEILRDDFSRALPGRYQVKIGEWKVAGGKYISLRAKPYRNRWTVADCRFTHGIVEVDAWARKPGLHGSTSLGLVGKYIDDKNYWRIQLNTYGKLRMGGIIGGKHWGSDSRLFPVALNKRYRLRLVWRGAEVGFYVNGQLIAVVTDPLHGRAGRPGLFTETAAEFDNFVVRRTRRQVGSQRRNRNTTSDSTGPVRTVSAARVLPGAMPAAQAEIWRDDFTGDRLLGWFPWSPETCEKVVKGGHLIDTSRSNRGWGPRRMWAGILFGDGTLTMRGKAIVDPTDPFKPNIGATVKHFSDDRYLRVLVGLHNDVRMVWRDGGQEKAVVLGNFTVELNTWYDMKISVSGSKLSLTVGGKRFETSRAPFAGKTGHPGFYAETPFTYDFIEVDPVQYAPGATRPNFQGTPALEPTFAV